MLEIFSYPETWASLLTLTVLEIVLGVDNLVFIAVITARLPKHRQTSARQLGLILACVTRLLLLAAINWLTHFTHPIITIMGQVFSGRDLILLGGGLFLLAKGTSEIHLNIINEATEQKRNKPTPRFSWIIIQIALLDIIFSLDSVITAVGMAQQFIIMAIAIIIAVILMIVASASLSRFIQAYPSLKMLALSFLLLVGMALIADGFNFHIPRGYLYFAIAFSLFVEILNIIGGRRKS
jgi:predicted tellurium resistance membrane protein TerC